MTKEQDISEINETIIYLKSANSLMKLTGKLSNNIYQSQFDQFITTTEKTINDLNKVKESLQTEIKEQTMAILNNSGATIYTISISGKIIL